MVEDQVSKLLDLSSYAGWMSTAVLGFIVFLVMAFISRKFGLDISFGKFGSIRNVAKKRKDPVTPLMVGDIHPRRRHSDCPLVGDVVLIVDQVKRYSYELFRMRYRDSIRDQMRFAEQHLNYMFEFLIQEYQRRLKEIPEVVKDLLLYRDMVSLCRGYTFILQDRFSSFFRDCFQDNGIDEFTDPEWKNYKKTQIEIMLSRAQSMMDCFYPHCLAKETESSCIDFNAPEFRVKVEAELEIIFDQAREISREVKASEEKLAKEFSGKLNKILDGEYSKEFDSEDFVK